MFDALQHALVEFAIGPGGYFAMFLYGALATTIIPLSPEVVAVAVWKLGLPAVPTITVLSIGNYAGNVLNYYLGYTGGRWTVLKVMHVSPERLDRSHGLFKKYGPPILLLSWLPIVGDPLTFIPGILKYDFLRFSTFVFIGKVVRYVALYAIFSRWI